MEVFPEIDLFPRLTRAARSVGRLLSPLPESGYPSEYPKHPERMISEPTDGEAYQPQFEGLEG